MSEPMKVSVEIEVQEIADAIIRKLTEDETLVEVVRCKDCKFYSRCTGHQGICTNRYMDGFIFPDWYCADAERKDDEAD